MPDILLVSGDISTLSYHSSGNSSSSARSAFTGEPPATPPDEPSGVYFYGFSYDNVVTASVTSSQVGGTVSSTVTDHQYCSNMSRQNDLIPESQDDAWKAQVTASTALVLALLNNQALAAGSGDTIEEASEGSLYDFIAARLQDCYKLLADKLNQSLTGQGSDLTSDSVDTILKRYFEHQDVSLAQVTYDNYRYTPPGGTEQKLAHTLYDIANSQLAYVDAWDL